MAPSKNITAYKQQLHERIVDTAMHAFAMHGIKAVRMDDIAQKLGISKRTLYELYRAKEDLLYEVMDRHRARQAAEMVKAAARCKNVMEILLQVYRMKLEEFKVVSPLFYDEITRYPRVMELLTRNRQQNHDEMLQFLRRGVSEGCFRKDVDFGLAIELFEAIGHHIMSLQLYHKYSMEQIFKGMVFTSLRGICTTRGARMLDELL